MPCQHLLHRRGPVLVPRRVNIAGGLAQHGVVRLSARVLLRRGHVCAVPGRLLLSRRVRDVQHRDRGLLCRCLLPSRGLGAGSVPGRHLLPAKLDLRQPVSDWLLLPRPSPSASGVPCRRLLRGAIHSMDTLPQQHLLHGAAAEHNHRLHGMHRVHYGRLSGFGLHPFQQSRLLELHWQASVCGIPRNPMLLDLPRRIQRANVLALPYRFLVCQRDSEPMPAP